MKTKAKRKPKAKRSRGDAAFRARRALVAKVRAGWQKAGLLLSGGRALDVEWFLILTDGTKLPIEDWAVDYVTGAITVLEISKAPRVMQFTRKEFRTVGLADDYFEKKAAPTTGERRVEPGFEWVDPTRWRALGYRVHERGGPWTVRMEKYLSARLFTAVRYAVDAKGGWTYIQEPSGQVHNLRSDELEIWKTSKGPAGAIKVPKAAKAPKARVSKSKTHSLGKVGNLSSWVDTEKGVPIRVGVEIDDLEDGPTRAQLAAAVERVTGYRVTLSEDSEPIGGDDVKRVLSAEKAAKRPKA